LEHHIGDKTKGRRLLLGCRTLHEPRQAKHYPIIHHSTGYAGPLGRQIRCVVLISGLWFGRLEDGLLLISPSAVSETLRQINDTGVSNAGAGAFLIQRLEGSRFGTVVLWVLNPYAVGENGRRREWIAGGHQSQPARDGFAEPTSLAAGDAGRGIALVVESPAKS
jgi:hypothetical protein